jgi:di/tricarboxylate transporter
MDQLIVFAVLLLALGLFAWGRIRHDLVALISLMILVLTGIVKAGEAFIGFGHAAVITVASVLVIGKALEFSGLTEWLGKGVMRIGNNPYLQVFALSALTAGASAFMNNVGALAIMMPIALHLSRKTGYSPSFILMPIAFASLLGGMTTLIGTPPNIIVSAFREEATGRTFAMFDYAPVGIVIAFAGVVFISLAAFKLLPHRKSQKSGADLFDINDYITEVVVAPNSKLIGKGVSDWGKISQTKVQILGLIRANRRIHAPDPEETLLEGDILILETDADELKAVMDNTGVALIGDKKVPDHPQGAGNIAVVEAVVMAGSSLLGRSVSDIGLRRQHGLNLLAVARREQKIHRRLEHIIFQTGDVLLLQGREDGLHETIASLGCLPLAKRGLRLGYRAKIPAALGIFGAAIAAVVAGLLPVEVAFTLAAMTMVLTGILPLKEVYTSIDWPVVVLLGAMIPVGTALETTGGAQRIADAVLQLANHIPSWGILTIVLVLTMCLSDVINNAATVVLMAPITIGVAKGLGLSVDPFLIAVAIGGSSAFLTPIGHQSNTLVMGPGGYKFTDYWRLGLPLEILIVLIGIPLILMLWPL